jgi:hypothetical protein
MEEISVFDANPLKAPTMLLCDAKKKGPRCHFQNWHPRLEKKASDFHSGIFLASAMEKISIFDAILFKAPTVLLTLASTMPKRRIRDAIFKNWHP